MTAHRTALLAAAALAVAGVGLAPSTAAAATGCAVTWGSLDKAADPISAPATAMAFHGLATPRTGHHACYDRVVIDVAHRW